MQKYFLLNNCVNHHIYCNNISKNQAQYHVLLRVKKRIPRIKAWETELETWFRGPGGMGKNGYSQPKTCITVSVVPEKEGKAMADLKVICGDCKKEKENVWLGYEI